MVFLKTTLIFQMRSHELTGFLPFLSPASMKASESLKGFVWEVVAFTTSIPSVQGSLPSELHTEQHPQYTNQTNTNKELPCLVAF